VIISPCSFKANVTQLINNIEKKTSQIHMVKTQVIKDKIADYGVLRFSEVIAQTQDCFIVGDNSPTFIVRSKSTPAG